jgi:hypothetical protein
MNLNKVKFLNTLGKTALDSVDLIKSSKPFSNEVIIFLDILSKEIFKDHRVKRFPDVATFAFYCRKSNILQLKGRFYNDNSTRLSIGVVFHIAPSNVPVNFAYTLLVGLLTGNFNIVRVPSKFYEQVEIIISAINALSNRDNLLLISNRIVLVSYGRTNNATEIFSSICHARVIWGGDETIKNIRENLIPARAFDVTFADRYSICIINADKFINEKHPEKIVTGFYNDTYLFDQNACTSPHLVSWTGSNLNVIKAKKIFWDSLHTLISSKYEIASVLAIDKVVNFCEQAIQSGKIQLIDRKDNLLWRVDIGEVQVDVDQFRCNSGYFSECHISNIFSLSKIINNKYQTLSYYGFSKKELKEFSDQSGMVGIDRIVPIGATMDFSLIWDGRNLINTLSREVEIV